MRSSKKGSDKKNRLFYDAGATNLQPRLAEKFRVGTTDRFAAMTYHFGWPLF